MNRTLLPRLAPSRRVRRCRRVRAGLMDLFVANDTVQNFLFANRGKGKWEGLDKMESGAAWTLA